MKRATKIWLIAATLLVAVGLILFSIALIRADWDIDRLDTGSYLTNRYDITDEYMSISIDTDTADIVFVPSADGNSTVTCYEQEHAKHLVTVDDGTLNIRVVDERSWYDHIGISFSTPKITVSVPRSEYGTLWVKAETGDVEIPEGFVFKSIDITESTGRVKSNASATEGIRIKTSTGSIKLEGVSSSSLELSVSTGRVSVSDLDCEGELSIKAATGKIKLEDIRCGSFTSKGSTGDIALENLIANGMLYIDRSTGDVELEGCDAAEILISTDTGDVEGTLLSDKVFITRTDTGKVRVPDTTVGGRCEITTDTGDIKLKIKQ
ncbi:MAG: DUF4097 family beta strand repeat protein [Clostridia bacterium]|nr:DUF4097 family beta strand repeat protein [Clostridia bacterium]